MRLPQEHSKFRPQHMANMSEDTDRQPHLA